MAGGNSMTWDKLLIPNNRTLLVQDFCKCQNQLSGLFTLLYSGSLSDDLASEIGNEIKKQDNARRELFYQRLKRAVTLGDCAGLTWIEEEILSAIKRIQNEAVEESQKYDCSDRGSTRYTAWRWSVLLRDNFTCQRCGKRSDLEAHHIVPYHENKELATDVNNGLTLCKDCHKAHHSENGYKTKGGSE
jgi:5-methylcytosine-specific restriction endonuclease McrA